MGKYNWHNGRRDIGNYVHTSNHQNVSDEIGAGHFHRDIIDGDSCLGVNFCACLFGILSFVNARVWIFNYSSRNDIFLQIKVGLSISHLKSCVL